MLQHCIMNLKLKMMNKKFSKRYSIRITSNPHKHWLHANLNKLSKVQRIARIYSSVPTSKYKFQQHPKDSIQTILHTLILTINLIIHSCKSLSFQKKQSIEILTQIRHFIVHHGKDKLKRRRR